MRSGLQRIDPGRRSLGDYAELAGEETVERIRALASDLEGMRVIHVSPAAPRNGCPELLRGLLPLAADAGVDVEWRGPYCPAPLRAGARPPSHPAQGAGTAPAPPPPGGDPPSGPPAPPRPRPGPPRRRPP